MPANPIPQELADTIVDPKAYQDGAAIDAAFATIRRDHPFSLAAPKGYSPLWVASRHADVMGIELRAKDFLNAPKSSVVSPIEQQAAVRFLTGGESNLIRSLVAVDGEEHKALRGIVFPAVTPQMVRRLEDDVRTIARNTVEHMLNCAPVCDFATDVAFLYPLRVIMRVLGIPPEDEATILKLTQEMFSSSDPELNRNKAEVDPAGALAQLIQTNEDLETYFLAVTERYRADPADTINSLIANATIDGEYLSHRQLMGYYIIAATAGHDTTSNTVAGAMWALAEQGGLLARLREEQGALDAFITESIRWVTPVKHFMRTAVQDTHFAGQLIAEGDYIMLSYLSANRDESVFDDPFVFSIDRKPNRHIAFGYGPHICLGQHLAKMEMRILWEELLPHLRSVELAGVPERTRSNFVCGPKHVPIRFELNEIASNPGSRY